MKPVVLCVAVLAAFGGAAHGLEFVPKMKWAQNSPSLFLTFEANCKGSPDFVVHRDDVSFRCVVTNGDTAAVKVDLREDATTSAVNGCKKRGKTQVCTVGKAEPHFFDHLLAPHEVERMEGVLSIDWRRWVEDDEAANPGMHDNPYDVYTDEFIVPLDDSTLDAAVAEHGRVVLDLWYPWCSACGPQRQMFIDVATRMVKNGEGAARGKLPLFARVDLRESRGLAHQYNVSCALGLTSHFTSQGGEDTGMQRCSLLILSSDEAPVVLEERTTEDELLEAVSGYVGPTVHSVHTAEDLAAFQDLAPVVVVGTMAADGDAFQTFHTACGSMRSLYPCAVAASAEVRAGLGVSQASLVVLKPVEDGSKATKAIASFDEFTTDAVSKWAQAESRALIAEYVWGVRDKIDSTGLPVAMVFVDDEDPEVPLTPDALHATLAPFHEVANAFRGKIVFLYFRKSNAGYMKDEVFGYEHRSLPALAVTTGFQERADKFKYTGKKFTTKKMTKFFKRFLAGELRPVRKSDEMPEEPLTPGVLNTVVYDSLAALWDVPDGQPADFHDAPDMLLALFKPWGETYPKKVQPLLRRIAAAASPAVNFLVGAMDTSTNYISDSMFPGVSPTDPEPVLVVVRGDAGPEQEAKPIRLKKLTQGKVLTALKKLSPAVKEAWDEIKAFVKDANARVKAEREEIQHKLETAEAVPLTDDGGVTKLVLQEGAGDEKPSAGHDVEAHYTGTLLDGTKFDSSRTRGDPFTFKLGQGQVIPCWDIAFATMNVGERAMLTCDAEYAYGDGGSPPKIPGGATLKFDVMLLGYSGTPVQHEEL